MSEGRVRGLWAPQTRGLTAGLVLSITFVASEALAVVTVMPLVAQDLGGLRLYGWVFSAFMLGSVVGIVVAGREADRRGPAIPFVGGLVLFASGLAVAGLAPSMAGLAGPALAAEVAHVFGWRWVFLGLLPVVAVAGAIAVPALARLGPPGAGQVQEHQLIYGIAVAAGATLILAGLTLVAGSAAAAAGAAVAGAALILAGMAAGL